MCTLKPIAYIIKKFFFFKPTVIYWNRLTGPNARLPPPFTSYGEITLSAHISRRERCGTHSRNTSRLVLIRVLQWMIVEGMILKLQANRDTFGRTALGGIALTFGGGQVGSSYKAIPSCYPNGGKY